MGNGWAVGRGPFFRLDILKTFCGRGQSMDTDTVTCMHFKRNAVLGQKVAKLWISMSPKIVHLLPTSSVTR